ncbi:MAG: general secretion pathway protein GspB [Gammaproteobacteria bacterium]
MTYTPGILLVVLLNVNQISAEEALPDPTRPYDFNSTVEIEQLFVPDKKVEWRLSGIRITEDQRTAIVNGKLVKEGDELDGATVVEIRPAEVVLLQEHKSVVVKLLLSEVKRPVAGDSEKRE